MRYLLNLTLALFFFLQAHAVENPATIAYLEARENDPESIIENVSTIHGNYSDYEIDLVVPGPDSLVLSRFYSSEDLLLGDASLGGWRFYPHCFLSIPKEARPKTYMTAEGKFDYTHIRIGTNEGSILTYAGWKNTTNPDARSLFKVDVEGSLLGLANTARGNINAWTNQKNNQLYFDAQSNCYELILSTGGKRIYVPGPPNSGLYLLQTETLPSGNKIFYEYEGTALCQIKMTNASEEKVFSWIRIQYGPVIHIDTSDGKTLDYHFQQDLPLLSEVIRSDKPALKYQYRIVDDYPLLIKKDLPEGRFVQIDYYANRENKNKVESVTIPAGISGMTSTRFTYTTEEDGSGFTQVNGPLTREAIYRFNDQLQLTAIEQYLSRELYRVRKKTWGIRQDVGNIIAISVEDGGGAAYYFKSFAYDDSGNIIEEKEYGNLTGTHSHPLSLDEDGVPEADQESHTKTYLYRTVKDLDIVSQKDPKGSSVKLFYKKGTGILLKKFLLEKKEIKKRWFYHYNDDGALIQTVVDDGDEEDFDSAYYIHERHITTITPKQELPNVGAPEVVEEKYLDPKKGQEILLKKNVFGFDAQGNATSIAVHDAKGEHRYTLRKIYEQGLLILETDPLGNEARYTYDSNQNLSSIIHSNSSLSFEYRYDLKNRLIYIGEKDGKRYCYSAFGEEEIFNQRGNRIADSALGNPWRYKAKRIDQEMGLIYFGKRYYSPKTGRWLSPDPIGSIDGPNLYRFCCNNPLKFVDHFGLASETGGDEFSKYFYGEYEPYCHCEQHRDCKRGGDIGRSLGIVDLLSNPRFQGSMQAFSGLVEAGIGGSMTLASGAIAAPLGWPVMAHGFDQFFTGMSAVFTGRLDDTVTSQLLQEAGLSPYAAELIDNSLSIAGSMGGIAAIHAGQLASFPNYCLPTSSTLSVMESGGWVLPKNGGGAFIHGRWYTEHALERMAPRTPRVMAELEARALKRTNAKGLQPGTEEFDKWMIRNGLSPRGIPPSVIEAEIATPGSTGVRVILNQRREVITVIPGGK